MKRRTILKFIGIGLLLILALVSIAPYFSAAAQKPVRVWVDYMPGKQAEVRGILTRAGSDFHYHFEQLGAFVVSLPPAALDNIRRNPNISGVEADPVRMPIAEQQSLAPISMIADTVDPTGQVIPYGIDMVQARKVWDANLDAKIDKKAPTGAGRTVCIIDTGLFDQHDEFGGVDIWGGYSQTNPDPNLWTYDGYGHGTHVAGTIVADNNGVGVVGVTPGTTSLYIIKIFDDAGEWVAQKHASDLVDAIYRCADAGANITSMSLGGSSHNFNEQRAFDSLYAAGILHVAAAGNGATDNYSYPASYDSVISVAAIDSAYTVADFSQYNDQVELAAPGVGVLSTVPWFPLSELVVDGMAYSGNHIEFSAYGSASGVLVDGGRCLTTGDWTGAVVLCERGDISFYEKVMNGQNSDGAAAVIYNNEPGNFLGTLGEGSSSTIVAISISQEDGLYLIANKLGLIGEVYSSITYNASGYEAWDGTSMATPHVSGVAALVWSANPSWTNVQIREALVASAMDLGDPGQDPYYGHGLVQAYDALTYLGYRFGGPKR
jgi:serine protease